LCGRRQYRRGAATPPPCRAARPGEPRFPSACPRSIRGTAPRAATVPLWLRRHPRGPRARPSKARHPAHQPSPSSPPRRWGATRDLLGELLYSTLAIDNVKLKTSRVGNVVRHCVADPCECHRDSGLPRMSLPDGHRLPVRALNLYRRVVAPADNDFEDARLLRHEEAQSHGGREETLLGGFTFLARLLREPR